MSIRTSWSGRMKKVSPYRTLGWADRQMVSRLDIRHTCKLSLRTSASVRVDSISSAAHRRCGGAGSRRAARTLSLMRTSLRHPSSTQIYIRAKSSSVMTADTLSPSIPISTTSAQNPPFANLANCPQTPRLPPWAIWQASRSDTAGTANLPSHTE